ncbi:MAG: hypothetical protein H0T65_22020, partial [Deltaproteobacteria bacterium]|nr:hypothetical protein [Deltaproteobacteria bacterium]
SEKPSDNRVIAIIVCLAAAAALAYACIATSWLYNPRNKQHFEVGFGLTRMFECEVADGGECKSSSNAAFESEWKALLADIRERAKKDPADTQAQEFAVGAAKELRVSGAWTTLGWITLGCAALAALSLLACVALVLAKKRIAWPILPTTTAILGLAIGLVTGCVFVALKPGPPGYVGVHLGFFAFGAGVLTGLLGALMMNKLLRPHDPDLLADSMDPEHY